LFGNKLKSELLAANLFVAQSRNPINGDYERQLKEYFNSSVRTVDFLFKSSEAVQQINEWVAESSRGKISSMLASELSPLSVIILLNAVYFKVSSHYNNYSIREGKVKNCFNCFAFLITNFEIALK